MCGRRQAAGGRRQAAGGRLTEEITLRLMQRKLHVSRVRSATQILYRIIAVNSETECNAVLFGTPYDMLRQ